MTHRVRGFVLTGRGSQSTADSMAVLTRHRTAIEGLLANAPDGPWMQAVTSERLREIDLS